MSLAFIVEQYNKRELIASLKWKTKLDYIISGYGGLFYDTMSACW
jgi:hypothetical protein